MNYPEHIRKLLFMDDKKSPEDYEKELIAGLRKINYAPAKKNNSKNKTINRR